MDNYLQQIIQLVLFVLPAYVANSAPLVLGGGTAIDFGRKISDGRRLFGKGKTIRGFVGGTAAGTLLGVFFSAAGIEFFGLSAGEKIALAFLLSFGALFGDLLGSFVKRRLGMAEGEPFFAIDQLLFLVVALTLVYVYDPAVAAKVGVWGTAFLVLLTFAAHLFFNSLAHRLKLKKVPW